jgi:putative transposase
LEPEEIERINRSQIVTGSQKHRGPRFPPRVFTQEGVAMLSGVLRSKGAVEVNVSIMRAFVRLRELLAANEQLARKVAQHDREIAVLFDHVQKMLAPVPAKKNPIGFIHHKDSRGARTSRRSMSTCSTSRPCFPPMVWLRCLSRCCHFQKYLAQIRQHYLAYPATMDDLVGLPESVRKQALERFRLLQPHIERNRPLRSVASNAGIPYRTAQRWVAQYLRFGLAALTRKKRADVGERRAVSVQIKKAIEGLALQKPPLPMATVYRQVCRFARDIGEKAPSYGTVFDIARGLPHDLLTLAHEGTKAYSEAFELIHRREAAGPNAIWQADHSPLDIRLVRTGAEPAKPWLTVVLDDYSRAVAGYFLSFDPPSTLHTALALRQAIWRKDDPRWQVCGIPEVLYTDHGSDFTSRHLEQVSADLKIRLAFSIPGKPRGRGRIERFFSTVNEMFLCELDGYAPPGGGIRGRPKFPLADFNSRFRAFLLDVYHRRECAETKIPPAKRWEASAFLPRMPDSLEQLDLLLIQVPKARQVRPDGIHFQGLRYLSTTLAAYVGETVTLRFDPRDMGEIRIFHRDKFLCRAVCPELAGATVSLREILRARNRRRRDLRGIIQDRQNAVETLLEMKRGGATEEKEDGPPAPAEKPSVKPSTPALKRYRNE